MTAQHAASPRFRRRTTLAENEYNTKFHMIDNDIAEVISSPEADAVTPLMSKIYLRLLQTPTELREGARVLRFEGEAREGKWVKAWDQLCRHLRVSGETANKALRWMHDKGVIGYAAFKNGVGIRIFLNRAASSMASRPADKPQKILRLPPASAAWRPASEGEAAFNDPFGDREVLDSDLNPRAPQNGADIKPVGQTISDPGTPAPPPRASAVSFRRERRELDIAAAAQPAAATLDELVQRLKGELEPCVSGAAARAAAREVAETRQWFETKALPKAVRVAQAETYDLLRKLGTLDGREGRARSGLEVGRPTTVEYARPSVVPLTSHQITETAEMCVALFEAQGKAIDETLSEISSEAGGWLPPEDLPRVRAQAERLLRAVEV